MPNLVHLLLLVLFVMLGEGVHASIAHAEYNAPARKLTARARPSADESVTSIFGVHDSGVVGKTDGNTALGRATGSTLIRVAVSWDQFEPTNRTPEKYLWYMDDYFKRLLDAGFRPVVMILNNPKWAANTNCGPIDTTDPNIVGEYSQFMNALAGHYSGVKLWSLYNEPDNSTYPRDNTGGCFGDLTTGDLNENGVLDYQEYVIMLGIARDAIRAANPDAQIALGGVGYDDFETRACPPIYPGACPPAGHFDYYWLNKVFEYIQNNPRPNGEPYADFLFFHYYDIYGPYWEHWVPGKNDHGVVAKAAVLRGLMAQYGLSFPLMVTETGEDSQDSWIGTGGQSKCVVINMVRGAAADVKGIFWWAFRDMPDIRWYYGLVDYDLNPKPSYLALENLNRQLDGYQFDKYVKPFKKIGVEAYRFVKGEQERLVMWSSRTEPDGKAPCAYPRTPRKLTLGPGVRKVQLVNLLGKATLIRDNKAGDLNKQRGEITFRVFGSPMYVTASPPAPEGWRPHITRRSHPAP